MGHMEKSEIIKDFEETGALLHGHFLLRSGLHSDSYFQAALLLQHTLIAAKLCAALAESFKDMSIETVISPAIGGIIVGQEVGRALGVKAVFAEDVVTKGGRVQQTIDLVREHGANPVGVAVLVDRSAGDVDFGIPMVSLLKLQLPTYEATECPLCKQGVPIYKPGSK